MALEENRRTRDYLYGRLLAVADKIERVALTAAEKGRETAAARYMQRFADHPMETWKNIELSLSIYKPRFGGTLHAYYALIDDIGELFETADFLNPKPLSGEFLLGYHCQNYWLKKHKSEKGKWVEREATEIDDETNESEED